VAKGNGLLSPESQRALLFLFTLPSVSEPPALRSSENSFSSCRMFHFPLANVFGGCAFDLAALPLPPPRPFFKCQGFLYALVGLSSPPPTALLRRRYVNFSLPGLSNIYRRRPPLFQWLSCFVLIFFFFAARAARQPLFLIPLVQDSTWFFPFSDFPNRPTMLPLTRKGALLRPSFFFAIPLPELGCSHTFHPPPFCPTDCLLSSPTLRCQNHRVNWGWADSPPTSFSPHHYPF